MMNELMDPHKIAQSLSEQLVAYVVVSLMLPLGTVGFTLLYFKTMHQLNQISQELN